MRFLVRLLAILKFLLRNQESSLLEKEGKAEKTMEERANFFPYP